ncbi:MAG TPA: CBS domain-containing protein, partial [Acidimicrobiia bacterium]|nr:CBS domain-containing protein [Acidimicrobiia bacterium]
LGLLEFMAGGDVGGLWLILLGWFLTNASRAEENQVAVIHGLRDVRVRDVMTPAPVTAPTTLTVADTLDRFLLFHHGSAFPLVDDHERVVGLVTLAQCKRVPPAERAITRVLGIATPLDQVPIAAPDEQLVLVLQRAAEGEGRILVMSGGALAGIITPSDITRALQLADVNVR